MKKIPDLPTEILQAASTNSLILLVGAGISKLFGMPLWGELADSLLLECENRGYITKSKAIIIRNSHYSSMQLVTIACSILDSKQKRLGSDIICKFLSDEGRVDKDKVIKIATILSKLNCTILTTNADTFIDKSGLFNDSTVYDNLPTDMNVDDIVGGQSIVHIHGSVNDPKNMIFTAPKYLEK